MPMIEWPKRNEKSGISRYCGALIWPRYVKLLAYTAYTISTHVYT